MAKRIRKKRVGLVALVVVTLVYIVFFSPSVPANPNPGDPIDSLNHVVVYYNGGFAKVHGRNVTNDDYNLGLKYQCVEFAKRYYYQHLNHKMPHSWGHAKDFFHPDVEDGGLNHDRGLRQYTNGSKSQPEVDDLLIMGPTSFNEFGHVCIISDVGSDYIEVIQQNMGSYQSTRERFALEQIDNLWTIKNSRILGWLRKD